jgi:hypothetical protein
MSWKCPACDEPIAHNAIEMQPRLDVVYRCPVCRLELVLDPTTENMVVAPFEDDGHRRQRPPRKV